MCKLFCSGPCLFCRPSTGTSGGGGSGGFGGDGGSDSGEDEEECSTTTASSCSTICVGDSCSTSCATKTACSATGTKTAITALIAPAIAPAPYSHPDISIDFAAVDAAASRIEAMVSSDFASAQPTPTTAQPAPSSAANPTPSSWTGLTNGHWARHLMIFAAFDSNAVHDFSFIGLDRPDEDTSYSPCRLPYVFKISYRPRGIVKEPPMPRSIKKFDLATHADCSYDDKTDDPMVQSGVITCKDGSSFDCSTWGILVEPEHCNDDDRPFKGPIYRRSICYYN